MRLLNKSLADYRSVLQHILQIDEVTVVFLLSKVIRIMEVDYSGIVSSGNLLRKKNSLCQILAYLSRHIISLSGVDDRILVGIFLLSLLIVKLNEGQNFVVCGVGLANERSGISICDICLSHLIRTMLHDMLLDHILNLFYRR